jgi:DNA ligase (NAD+)
MDEINVHSLEVQGMGDAVKSAIINGIKANRDLILKLLQNGVTIDGDVAEKAGAKSEEKTSKKPFDGMSFCLTGTRAYIKEIEALGGNIKSGVSKDLTFLVQADPMSMSSKTQKAESYGIPIISVEYLEKAIKGEVKLDVDVMQ